MRKKMTYMFLILVIMVISSACSLKESEFTGNKEVEYKVIELSELEDAQLKLWYQENYKKKGSHSTSGDGIKYLIISAGEKPTGGYSVELTNVEKKDEKIVFHAELKVPKEGEMVTQALTYPHILIEVKAEPEQTVVGVLKDPEEKEEKTTKTLGVYVGRIDNNSIEIKLEGEPKAFWLDEKVKPIIEQGKFTEGDKVSITYYKDQHDRMVLIKIEKLK